MLLILCGYTATGKDTYQNMLLSRNKNLHRAVSHTTRPKRPGEKDCIDYYFVSLMDFFMLDNKKQFLETRVYQTYEKGEKTHWYYGLSKKEIEDHENTISIIDFPGTLELINRLGRENVKVVYLTCDEDELRRRSAARLDELKEFNRRLEDDKRKFNGVELVCDITLNTHTDEAGHLLNISAIEALLED